MPTITGTATEDQTLTADTSGISDADGLGSFSYQWLRDGSAISGATSSSYTLTNTDVGSKISVQVSYADGNGTIESLTSAQTTAVTNVNDAPVGSGSLTTTMLNDNDGPIKLFGSLNISDPDNGENDLTLRIILSNSDAGTLSGGGFSETGSGTGIYTASGLTVAQANTALDNVLFTPTDNTGSSGSFTLDISVDVNDGESGFQPVLSATTLTINRVNDVPVITGNNLGSIVEDVDPDADTLLETSGILKIADADQGDAKFQAGSVVGTYGSLTIDTLGNWSYAANNTQAAIQHLDAGESLSEILTIATADGTSYDITIIISGAEDAAVIAGTTTGSVTEDGTLTTHGVLTISDVDTHDNPVSFPNISSTPGDNGYGEFNLADGTWTYTLGNGLATVQELNTGETLTDTHTFIASNGLAQQVTISIIGVSDAPNNTAIDLGNVEESGLVTISQADLLNEISDGDVDGLTAQNLVLVNGNGTLTDNLDGTWTFTPATHWNGSASFEFEINDGSVVKTVAASLNVIATNPPAVHVASDSSVNEASSVPGNALVSNTLADSQDQTGQPDNLNEAEDSGEQLSGNNGNSQDEDTVDVGGNEKLPTATPMGADQTSIDAESSLGLLAMNNNAAELPPINSAVLTRVIAGAPHNPDPNESTHYKPILPKSIDLRKLDLSSFHLIDQAPITINSPMDNPSFIGGLEAMDRDLEEAMEDSNSRHRLGTEAMAGVSISLSAGFVSWMLRTGTLLGSFLSVAPLWKQLDPLPILGAVGIKKLKAQIDRPIIDGEEDAKVERLFKKETSA